MRAGRRKGMIKVSGYSDDVVEIEGALYFPGESDEENIYRERLL